MKTTVNRIQLSYTCHLVSFRGDLYIQIQVFYHYRNQHTLDWNLQNEKARTCSAQHIVSREKVVRVKL